MKSTAAILLGFVLCSGMLCQQAPVPSENKATFQGLGDLPGGDYQSVALAVSGDGTTVVGWSKSGEGDAAFRWQGGVLSDLQPGSPYKSTIATGVSKDGYVVVGLRNLPDVGTVAVRWTAAEGFKNLNDPYNPLGEGFTTASGVSADGSIVVGRGKGAFRWTGDDGLTHLSGLPQDNFSEANGISADGSTIVGSFTREPGLTAFGWSTTTGLIDLGSLGTGGRLDGRALAASADGLVIVGQSQSEAGGEAFRWTQEAGMIGLGDLAGGDFDSTATGVSGDGSVVVGASAVDVIVRDEGNAHYRIPIYDVFIWDQDHGMRSLGDVLVSDYGLDLGEWKLTSTSPYAGISEDGLTIVGTGTNPHGQPEAWIVHLSGAAD